VEKGGNDNDYSTNRMEYTIGDTKRSNKEKKLRAYLTNSIRRSRQLRICIVNKRIVFTFGAELIKKQQISGDKGG